jgi:hypothetical protein
MLPVDFNLLKKVWKDIKKVDIVIYINIEPPSKS